MLAMRSSLRDSAITLVLHTARQVDHRGIVKDAWIGIDEFGIIAAMGTGDDWHALGAQHAVDAESKWLTPGLVDIHGHGGGSVSYEQPADDPLIALEMHRSHGVTAAVLSLVSAPIDTLCADLRRLATLDDLSFLGVHLEGPFLAASFKGAHDESALTTARPEVIDDLLEAADGKLLQITMAPELPGAVDAIHRLVRAGVRVALGHTAANYEQACAAFDAGASLLTHTFNGMPTLHHREPGPLLAAFERPEVTLELILDGVHVHPAMARWLFETAPNRVALITDAMAAAGQPDGSYRLGTLDVTVHGGIARLAEGNSIAGSTLTLDRAIAIAHTECGLDPVDAITAATHTPARALGLDHHHGTITVGRRADLVLMDTLGNIQRVWQAGVEIAPAAAQ